MARQARMRCPRALLRLEHLEDRLTPSNWLVDNAAGGIAGTGNSGTLAYCVQQANSDSTNAVITFNPTVFASATTITPTATLTLSNTASSITIDGSGAGPITISGGGTLRIFTINASVTATIQNVTLSGGSVSGSGGAVSTAGTLTIASCTITSSTATSQGGGINVVGGALTVNSSTISGNSVTGSNALGGGIAIAAGTLSVNSSTLSNNAATVLVTGTGARGGAIGGAGTWTISGSTIDGNSSTAINPGLGGRLYCTGTLTVQNTTVSNNTASWAGGGICVDGAAASATIDTCTISGNSTGTGNGGGIAIERNATATVDTCTVTGNTTASLGGGIFMSMGALTVQDCTLSGNSAQDGGGIRFTNGTVTVDNSTIQSNTVTGSGGGIYMNTGTLTVRNSSTIQNNTAAGVGGGICTAGGATTIDNSTISGNTATSSGGGIQSGGATLTVQNTTLQNNTATSAGGGGILLNGGAVTLDSCTLLSNTAANGGGIYSQAGTLTVLNSLSLRNNTASSGGGGIYSVGALTVNNQWTISGNSAASGGGIYSRAALTVDNTTISGNTASLYGGGIYSAGTLTMQNSATIQNNTASDQGGGIYVVTGTTAIINNCTFTGNNAGVHGGAMANFGGTLTVTGSTITGNRATNAGGGIQSDLSSARITLQNCTLQGNTAAQGGVINMMGQATLNNCTLQTNTATGLGGAIENSGGTLLVQNGTTISGNTGSAGGAIHGSFWAGTGATITVDNSTISGNTTAGNGGGIDLSSGTLTVTNSTISNNTSAAGGGINTAASTTTTVTGSTLANNRVTGSAAPNGGGGIANNGTMTITGSTIDANQAFTGGGIICYAGTLTMQTTTVSGNSTTGNDGGGIDVWTSASIVDCIVTGNTANNGAGIQFPVNGSGTIQGTTVTNNVATNRGGGIHANGATNTVTVANCTISGNQAPVGAGVSGGQMTLANCTIAGNTASTRGGGVNVLVTTTVVNTAIAGNSAPTGGGVFVGGALTLINSIVAGNTGSSPDVAGNVGGGGNNLIGDGTGMTGLVNGVGGNQVGTGASPINPLLLALGNYGGSVRTMPLFQGPAVNAGAAVTTLPSTLTAVATSFTVANVQAIAQTIASVGNNCVLQIDNEQMLVTAVNVGTNTVTVTRAYNSTTAATHNAGAGVGLANDEIGLPRINGSGQTNLGASSLTVPIVFAAQPPASIAAGSTFSVGVQATSTNGINVAALPLTLTLSAGTLQGSPTASTNAAGLATFSGLSVNTPGTYTLTASYLGTVVATSNPFTITAGPVATLTFTVQPPASAFNSTTFSPVVQAMDQFGNLVPNATVNLTISAATFTGPNSATTDAAGLATFSNLRVATPGTYTLQATVGAANVTSSSFTIIGPGLTIVESGSTDVAESGGTDTYTIVLNSLPLANVIVAVNSASSVSVAPTPLTFTPGNWNVPQTVTVSAVDDFIAQGLHTGVINHAATSTDPGYTIASAGRVTANVADNDTAGVNIAPTTVNVSEAGTTDVYRVTLNSQPTANVVLAINPDSRVTVALASLVFTPTNWSVDQTVTVAAVDDTIIEGLHTGLIAHSASSSDASYGGRPVPTVTASIADNDTPSVVITLTNGPITLLEGTGQSYTAVLNTAPSQPVVVSAVPGAQVSASPATLTFTPANWNTPQPLIATAVDDSAVEGTHQGVIAHMVTTTDPLYVGTTVAAVTASIVDNDGITIDGTDRADKIVVTFAATQIRVSINNKVTLLPSAGVQMVIQAHGGADYIEVDSPGVPVMILGGQGADRLFVNGSGSFVLDRGSISVSGVEVGIWDTENLVVGGGKSSDVFAVQNVPAFATEFKGNTGNDTVIGPDQANNWKVTTANGGTLDGSIKLTGIPNWTGGAGRDHFSIARAVSGVIDGGGGGDTLDFSSVTSAVTVNLQSATATLTKGTRNFAAFIGGRGSADKLIAADQTNAWSLTSTNGGSVNSVSFQAIENLAGGLVDDSFSFLDNASVKGKIDGGGGSDVLDYSAILTPVTVNLQAKTATRTGGFLNMEQFQGSGLADTLIAANVVNAWLLNGSGAGTIAAQLLFGNFENLTGGSQADSFVLVGGDWLGILKGGAGQDSVQADPTRINRWVNLGLGRGTLNDNPFESVEFHR